MISNIGEIVSFEKMDDTLFEFEGSHNSIKNLIYRLKKKYDFNYIKNVKNVGYILVQDN
jgi:DNA-binding response OmpR family regulator